MGIWSKVKEVNTAYAIVEKMVKLSIYMLVLSGGSLAWVLASLDPFFKNMTYFRGFLILVIFSLLLSLILYLINLATKNSATRKYYNSLATTSSNINPLNETFEGLIINLEDLRLPLNKVHENKRFKRCDLVGPMTIALVSGSLSNSHLNVCHEIIALPEGEHMLPGVIKFLNCTFIECRFVQVTIMTNPGTAKQIQGMHPSQKVIDLG